MALASMTGFAREQGAHEGFTWVFELRSVNGRGLDVRVRAQNPFDALEGDIRAAVQKRLARGNVSISLSARREAGAAPVRINEALFAELAETAERLTWTAKLATVTFGDLLAIPGVIETGEGAGATLSDDLTAAVMASLDRALDGLVAARRDEGKALEAVLKRLLGSIGDAVAAAEVAEATRAEAIQGRLKTQVEALMAASDGLDPQRLHQEAALIAARIDVREEIDRLKAHIDSAARLIGVKEPVGRKLDFLTQEFGREANTLCSKANDIALTRIGLDLKTWVEQFREQVQNIE